MRIRFFLEERSSKVSQLEVIEDGVSFVDNFMASLSNGAKPCLVAVVPHAPHHCNNELDQVIPHVLHKYEVLEKINKLPEADTPSIKRYSRGQPYFMCLGAIPKQMSTCFFSPTACFTGGIINHSTTTRVYLHREDVVACFPCKSFQFFRDIKAP